MDRREQMLRQAKLVAFPSGIAGAILSVLVIANTNRQVDGPWMVPVGFILGMILGTLIGWLRIEFIDPQ